MMNRVNGLQRRTENIAYFETFEVIDKEVYAFLWWKNILIKIIPDSGETELLMLDDTYFFKHCISDGEKIYFADNLGKALVIYDLDSKVREEYSLDSGIKDDNNIVTVENYAGNVFIIENYRGNIYSFNKESKDIEKDCSFSQMINRKSGREVLNINCWKVEDYLYLRVVYEDACEIFKYNLRNRRLEKMQETVLPEKINESYCFEGRMYMLQDDFNIIVWNIQDNTVDRIEMTDLYQLLGENKPQYAFSSIAVTKKNIWLLPSSEGKDIYIYDISKKNVSRYDDYPLDFFYLDIENWSKYSDIKERQGSIYVAARSSNYYLIIDVETGTGMWKPAYVNDFDEYYHYYKNKLELQTEKIANEQCIPLKTYLSYFQKKTERKINEKNIGQEVWKEARWQIVK